MKMKDVVFKILFLGFVLLVFGGLWFLVGMDIYHNNEACRALGFVERGSTISASTCEDSEGNLHYVKFEGFWHITAKPITVGDNRIVK